MKGKYSDCDLHLLYREILAKYHLPNKVKPSVDTQRSIGDHTDVTSWLPYGAQAYLDPIHFPIDHDLDHHLNDFQAS